MGGRHDIITQGNDPNTCGGLQMIPLGSNRSAQLGNGNTGAQGERLTYTMAVSSLNAFFVYKYACVLEDPGHSPSEQLTFQARLLGKTVFKIMYLLYNNHGTYTYTVIGTDIYGCEITDDVSIIVFPQPNAAFEVNQNDLMFAFINQSIGAVNYTWDLGDGSSIQDGLNVYHYYADLDGSTYTVSLIAASEFGCLDTTNIQVSSPLPILFYVPNTFTPD